jgi:hypothetical protein
MTQDAQEKPAQAGDSAEEAPMDAGESTKFRRRALLAESRCREFENRLRSLEADMQRRGEELAASESQRDELRHQLVSAENRRLAERAMLESGVSDVEAATLLLGRHMDLADETADVESIRRGVEKLLLDKPYLRAGSSHRLPPRTAGAASAATSAAAELADAAQRAARSGDRRDVARYLHLRRRADAGEP